MAIKEHNVAYGVRVKLLDNFEEKCLGDTYLVEQEDTYFIQCEKPYSDERGQYVMISGGSHMNSGRAYFDELELEFPYDVSDKIEVDKEIAENFRQDTPEENSVVFILTKSGNLEKAFYREGHFEGNRSFVTSYDIYGWVYQTDLMSFIFSHRVNDEDFLDNLKRKTPDNKSLVVILTKNKSLEMSFYRDGKFERGNTGMNYLSQNDLYSWVYRKDLLTALKFSPFKIE